MEDVQYATGKEQTALTNSSRKNETAGPQWNNAHLWRWLEVKVNSDAVKNNIA